MNKPRLINLAVWIVAILLTIRLSLTVHQHDIGLLDTATIAIFSLYGTRAGGQHLADLFTRRSEATR